MAKTNLMNSKEHVAAKFDQFEPGYKPPDPEPPKKKGFALTAESGRKLNITSLAAGKFAYDIWTFKLDSKGSLAVLEGISREGLMQLVNRFGYLKRYRSDNTFQYIHEKNNIIMAVEVAQIRDAVSDYVKHAKFIKLNWDGLPFIASPAQLKETFLRNSPSLFNDPLLGHLSNHEKPILHDNESEMYFPFLNCIVVVTAEEVRIMPYSELNNQCIWKDHIIKKSFSYSNDFENGQYAAFIRNVASNEPDRINAFHSAIGYLMHNYSYPTTSRAVIAYDEQLAGKNEPAGGTGKGVFIHGVEQLRTVAIIDGKKIKDDNQFSYQMVTERTQVIAFDDVKHDFDFLVLNSNLTTGWQVEWKHKGAFRFAPKDNPKTYITSNTILNGKGSTVTRRQFIIEFSSFYSKLVADNIEPIVHIHGCMFFSDDWSLNEWNKFFTFMLNCAKCYLEKGLIFYKLRSVAENKMLQNTSSDFAEWVNKQNVEQGNEFSVSEWFSDFKALYYGEESDFKQRAFTNWLKIFALSKEWKLEMRRINEGSQKVVLGKFTKKDTRT